MNASSLSSSAVTTLQPPALSLRNVPIQARSRQRLAAVLDAAETVLAEEGVDAFTTNRVAEVAGIPVGSVYRFFAAKEAIVEALAMRFWAEFAELVSAVAESDERDPLSDPGATVLGTLAAGFRARPAFLALWYGGLRSARVREATRPTRAAIGVSVARILAVHWPRAEPADRDAVARMLVIAGDGLLREAFRASPDGDAELLAESRAMLGAYMSARLEVA
jgi:AcrR family transcriptional regulator